MCVICGVYVSCNCIEGISDGTWGLEVGVGNQLQLLFYLFYWGRVSVKFRTRSLPLGIPCLFWNYRWMDHYAHLTVMFILEHPPCSLFLLLHDNLSFLPLLFWAILDVCLNEIIFPFVSGLFHFVLKVYYIITCMRILSLYWDHMIVQSDVCCFYFSVYLLMSIWIVSAIWPLWIMLYEY